MELLQKLDQIVFLGKLLEGRVGAPFQDPYSKAVCSLGRLAVLYSTLCTPTLSYTIQYGTVYNAIYSAVLQTTVHIHIYTHGAGNLEETSWGRQGTNKEEDRQRRADGAEMGEESKEKEERHTVHCAGVQYDATGRSFGITIL